MLLIFYCLFSLTYLELQSSDEIGSESINKTIRDISMYDTVTPIPWKMWVDLEGFRKFYRENESDGLLALRALIKDLYLIGNDTNLTLKERLFIHRLGVAHRSRWDC